MILRKVFQMKNDCKKDFICLYACWTILPYILLWWNLVDFKNQNYVPRRPVPVFLDISRKIKVLPADFMPQYCLRLDVRYLEFWEVSLTYYAHLALNLIFSLLKFNLELRQYKSDSIWSKNTFEIVGQMVLFYVVL